VTAITLSFDNGPDPEVTPQVLDTLQRRQIAATFFVLGEKLRDRRKLAERAHAEGHWIGNHTFTHMVPLGLTREPGLAAAEIERTQTLIGDLAHPRRFFRPFGGGGNLDRRLLNHEAFEALRAGGFTCVVWNAVPEDWAYPGGWVDRALELCFVQEHAVLVLHDLPTGAMRNLDRFLGMAADRGAIFKQNFPESCVLLERGRVVRPIEPYLAEAAA